MEDYSRPLAKAIQEAREECGYSQLYVAERIGVTDRSISNIETGKANLSIKILYPLIRVLSLDANKIFHSEMYKETSARQQLQILLAECSDSEILTLIPICRAIIDSWRNKEPIGTIGSN